MLIEQYVAHNDELTLENEYAQAFSLKSAMSIGRIQLYLKRTGSPGGYLQVSIYDDDGGPNAAISNGTSDPVLISNIDTDYAWVDFSFDMSNRPFLSADTTYYIVLTPSAGYTQDASNDISVSADQTDPYYTYGSAYDNDGGWATITTETDICFKLYSSSRSTVYGELHKVEALLRRMSQRGAFNNESNPTVAEIVDIMDDTSDMIDGWLDGAGIDTPLSTSAAINLVNPYALWGIAMSAHMAHSNDGFAIQDGDTPASAYRSRFYELRDALLNNEGIARAIEDSESADRGLAVPSAGHIDTDERDDTRDDDSIIQPKFKMNMFDRT